MAETSSALPPPPNNNPLRCNGSAATGRRPDRCTGGTPAAQPDTRPISTDPAERARRPINRRRRQHARRRNAKIKAEGEQAKESCDKSLQEPPRLHRRQSEPEHRHHGHRRRGLPVRVLDRRWHRCSTAAAGNKSRTCGRPRPCATSRCTSKTNSSSATAIRSAPCFQPFVSGAHFFTRPVLPYCMGVEPPCECIYALGHYRPGNCAPYMCNPVPLSCRGALFEAGVVTGVSAALP